MISQISGKSAAVRGLRAYALCAQSHDMSIPVLSHCSANFRQFLEQFRDFSMIRPQICFQNVERSSEERLGFGQASLTLAQGTGEAEVGCPTEPILKRSHPLADFSESKEQRSTLLCGITGREDGHFHRNFSAIARNQNAIE